MEDYKKTIKRRRTLFILIALIAAGIGIYDGLIMNSIQSDNIVFSFQCGLAIGIGFLATIKLFRYSKVLKDDMQLKIEYNKENDERSKSIRSKAGMPMLMITSGLILLAGVIAGYFNELIFITLIVVAVCQLTIGTVAKVYYIRKM